MMVDIELIVIIGMGCWFLGGVGNLEELWNFVSEGCFGWLEVLVDRWNVEVFYYLEKNFI